MVRTRAAAYAACFLVAGAATALPARADDAAALKSIRAQLARQAKDIAAQKDLLTEQRRTIDALMAKLSSATPAPAVEAVPSVPAQSAHNLAQQTQAVPIAPAEGNGKPAQTQVAQAERSSAPSPAGTSGSNPAPTGTVGQAPEEKTRPPQVETIASVGGVLTRGGNLVLEPYAEYVHTSVNQFTFEGVQIIDSLLLGVISAGRTQQDLGLFGGGIRYGITDRLEIEARVPYIFRGQTFNGTILNSSNQVINQSAHGNGLGDIEAAVHYQINDGTQGWPFFIGNLRFKSDTGTGPADVSYNTDGSAKSLPTGSGFNAINPSITAIWPSDPAVLYANIGWIHNFQNSTSLTINSAIISDIHPGDTYSASFGMGLAINDAVSFSLGYEQDYIMATSETVNQTRQSAQPLLPGSLALGFVLRTDENTSYNLGLNVGVTRDSPDVAINLRVPITFSGFGIGL